MSQRDDYQRAGGEQAGTRDQSFASNAQNGQAFDKPEELVAEDMTWCGSLWLVAKRSTPTILTMIFFQMVQLLNIYYVGQMSSELLAGVGLGNMLLNVFVFAITMGLNGTIETFVAWSFGQKDYKMCGTHLNRARVVVSIAIIPVILTFLFMDRILISLQQDEEIAKIARDYAVWTIPGWFCLVHFDCTKRFLQSIHRSVVSTTTQLVTTVLHIGWGYLFIIHLDMGVAGAAIALNLTYCVNYTAQEVYINLIEWQFFKDFMQPFFVRDSFNWKGSKEFLRLGVPGTLMQCAEWWAFELLAIFAGMLGKHQLAAQVAVINIIGFLYMVPLGVQFAAAATVGGQVGAGNPSMAKKHGVTHVAYAVFIMTLIMICMMCNEDAVAGLFTDDETDMYYIKEVIDLLSAYLVLDAVHGVNTGIVRALGKQFHASIATLCCYYIFGMPIALILGFKMDMGVRGFWLGFTVALTLQDIIVTTIICCSNWNVPAPEKDSVGESVSQIIANAKTAPLIDPESKASINNWENSSTIHTTTEQEQLSVRSRGNEMI